MRLADNLPRGAPGDDAQLALRLGERRLDVQPRLEARRLGEQRPHAGIVDPEGRGLFLHGVVSCVTSGRRAGPGASAAGRGRRGLRIDEQRQGARRVERAGVLEPSRLSKGDAVGLTGAEDDRADLVDGVIVVREDEHVADADREVDRRRQHAERLAGLQARRRAGRDHVGQGARLAGSGANAAQPARPSATTSAGPAAMAAGRRVTGPPRGP